MKIALVQSNFWIGDFSGNAKKILRAYRASCRRGAELVVTTELALFGYPPKDMLLDPDYLAAHDKALKWLAAKIGGIGLVVGIAEKNYRRGKPLFNSVVLIQNGVIHKRHRKALLPTYDVFDELRYFEPGSERVRSFKYKGRRVAMLVCEDIWDGTENPDGRRLYRRDPIAELKEERPDILIVSNGSPYYWGKGAARFRRVSQIARRLGCVVMYANQVGGNDDLIFDGRSFAVDQRGRCIGLIPAFVEDYLIVDTESPLIMPYLSDVGEFEDLRRGLVLGIRDYVYKTGHDAGVVALSGGIDSAVVAYLTAEALGRENVLGVGMPSPFSSEGSVVDAKALAQNLGIAFHVVPIDEIYHAVGRALAPVIGWYEPGEIEGDVTEENAQARIRGMLVMAVTNRKGGKKYLLISTGNKSEIAMSYCTLYGDMAGGFAPLSDVFKTNVFKLARYINDQDLVIPASTLTKPPSAELRPGQKDEDALPPYPLLDSILRAKIEEMMSWREVIRGGAEKKYVVQVVAALARSEFKRQQMAFGPKVSAKAFGTGRRWPIAAKAL